MAITFLLLALCFWNICQVLADCGGTLTDSVGSFSSPDSDGDGNYDANVRCEWNIEAAENKYIMLEINSIDIEDAYCIYDYILIYDGYFSKGKYCGVTGPEEPITSESRRITVVFVSDDVYTFTGFTASYQQFDDPVCGYHVADFPYGSFGSNDVDEAGFYSDVSCVWTISSTITNSTQAIELLVSAIGIPEQETCGSSKLEIYDSETNFGQYCGTTPPPKVTSTSDTLQIHLGATGSFDDVHFKATYLIRAEKCGGILTESTGTIISPDDDQDSVYDKDLQCLWMIIADADQVISFQFSQMDLFFDEDYVPCSEGDRIEFYNVYNNKDQELIDVFCGTELPPVIRSRTNVLLVRFVTDLWFESTGFIGTYSATNGTGVMPSTTTVWPDTSIGTDGDSDVFTDFSSTTITEPNLNTTGTPGMTPQDINGNRSSGSNDGTVTTGISGTTHQARSETTDFDDSRSITALLQCSWAVASCFLSLFIMF